MKKFLFIVFIASIAFGITSCSSAKIMNVSNTFFSSSEKKLTMEEMGNAIKAAGQRLRWTVIEISEGKIEASISVRSHKAMIMITYKPDMSYNIDYISSVNLNEKEGSIHRNYNRWIAKLNKAINLEISKALTAN